MGAAAAIPSIIGAGLSLASLGMKSGSDVAAGYAKKQEYDTKATDYLLQSEAQATNYRLQGTSAATNYRYRGQQEQEQFGITAGQDTMQASQAETAAQFGDLQASMTDASARQSLSTTLGNITTARLAGGTDLTSPTTAALEGRVTGIADLNRTAAMASIKGQTAEERAAAAYLHEASAFALTQGANAKAMGEYNATNAETFATYNANAALTYGRFNAAAATAAGNTAAGFGYANAGTDILGGLGKAFSSFSPGGSSPSAGSGAP